MTEEEKLIEEYKEIGHEYRYRDRLMVQEFGLALAVAGLMMNFLGRSPGPGVLTDIVFKVLGLMFLAVVSLHLAHINQDRRAALARKEKIRDKLTFEQIHGGVGDRRVSVPRLMVWVTGAFACGWLLWLAITIRELFKS